MVQETQFGFLGASLEEKGARQKDAGIKSGHPSKPRLHKAVSLVQSAAATRAAVVSARTTDLSETGAVTEGPGLEVDHATTKVAT